MALKNIFKSKEAVYASLEGMHIACLLSCQNEKPTPLQVEKYTIFLKEIAMLWWPFLLWLTKRFPIVEVDKLIHLHLRDSLDILRTDTWANTSAPPSLVSYQMLTLCFYKVKKKKVNF